jgi:hypothetical protein
MSRRPRETKKMPFLPLALSDLIMELLQKVRCLRPASSQAVLDRLAAIELGGGKGQSAATALEAESAGWRSRLTGR